MKNVLFRILFYVLGGIIGYVIGLVICPFLMDAILPHSELLLFVTTSLGGILVAALLYEFENSMAMKRSKKIHDEAVALITHEMRTGLTSTGWAIQGILEKYDAAITPDDKKMLQSVYDSIHTTVMHSVNLLDISMIDSGKISISLEWTTLEKVGNLFNETIERYKMGAEKENIKISSNVNLDPKREVQIDMTRFRIILENLLENALQYTKGNVREVKVEISNDKDDLNLKVADSGLGIPKSEQGKIFSEFYRATNARKMLSSGSGIGLYLCHQYAEAHHGKIWFESEEGKGTTFFVRIPLKTVADVNQFLEKV